MKRLVAAAAGELDWHAIEARATAFPRVGEVVLETSSKQRRLGDCSILVEWLHLGTPGTLRRVAAIEDDLRTLAGVAATGLDQLVRAMASGERDQVFNLLSELFVAAWYVRSGRRVIAVHADHGRGDVIIADGSAEAHVEVMDLSAPVAHRRWEDAWGDLVTRLQSLELPLRIDFHGAVNMWWEVSPEEIASRRVDAPVPDLHDIAWIVQRVVEAVGRPRPFTLERGFSRKYPGLAIDLTDGPSAVIGSWGASGWAYPPDRFVDRILAHERPSAPGRRVLVVETSRYPGDVLDRDRSKRDVQELIERQSNSWDVLVAFNRAWTTSAPCDVHVLHVGEGAEPLLPQLPERDRRVVRQ